MQHYNHIRIFLRSLRLEELLGMVFIVPSLLIRLYAFLKISPDETLHKMAFEEDIWWIGFISLLILLFYYTLWKQQGSPVFRRIRDFAPILFVLAIFANLQIAIYLINPHDVHFALMDMDQWIFGVQPTVWMEQFYHPWLTEWFSFTYINYYWITVVLVIVLYRKGQLLAFRSVIFTVMVAYYIGFSGYILFPAASPYLIISDLYSTDIWQGGSIMSETAQAMVNLSPARARDAFPSMHNSITLLTMIFAWRYSKIIFWIFFPVVVSLPISTIYLRYHFVVDIFAGFIVTFLAIYLSPKLDIWWHTRQREQGITSDVDQIYGA